MGAALVAAGLSACTDSGESEGADFCAQLRHAAGPLGASEQRSSSDPLRFEDTLRELRHLREVASDEILASVTTLVSVFEAVHNADPAAARDHIAAHDEQISASSEHLRSYALTQCGIILERVLPTPIPDFGDVAAE